MNSWDRTLDITINTSSLRGSPLVRNPSDATPVEVIEIIARDTFPLRLLFVQSTGNLGSSLQGVRIEEGATIVLGAKALNNLGGESLLFFAEDFIEGGDEETGFHYTSILNTNTETVATLINALSGNNRSIQIIVDIEIRNIDNSERTTLQFLGLLKADALRGTEGVPSDSDPPYPAPSSLALLSQTYGDLRITTGGLELRDEVTNVWRRINFHDGQLQFTEL